MLITELEVGGAEQRFCDIACSLDPERFDVRVCSLGPPPEPPRDVLLRRLDEAGVDVRHLQLRSVWSAMGGLRAVSKWIVEQQLDVLQCFLFHANVLGALAAPRKLPVSLGLRVADPRRWRSRLERFAARSAARIVCVSEQVRQFAAREGFPEAKLQVIENGIALPTVEEASSRRQVAEDSAAPILVFVGRLDHQKGVDWLIENASTLLADAPTARLRLIGDGPLRAELQASVEHQRLTDRIELLGWREDALARIAAADLLLLPSRWEGMPNVVLEAMGLGRAVLCAKAEGVRDLLGDEAERQTVTFGDVSAWRERIGELLNNGTERRRLGEANRQRISQHFSQSRMVAEFQALFSQLANSPEAERR